MVREGIGFGRQEGELVVSLVSFCMAGMVLWQQKADFGVRPM